MASASSASHQDHVEHDYGEHDHGDYHGDHDHGDGATHEHVEGHNCVHGQLARVAPVAVVAQNYAVPDSELQRVAELPEEAHGRRVEADWVEADAEGAEPPAAGYPLSPSPPPPPPPPLTDSTGRLPLRIHFDVSKLSEDPGRSCFDLHGTYRDEKGNPQRCGWGDIITPTKRALLADKLLPAAGQFLTDLLAVHRVVGPLFVHETTCGFQGGVEVPSWMRTVGVPDADFVIFLTMRPIEAMETVAFSGHCQQDQTGRPIAAQFNWAPAQLRETSSQFMIEYYTRVALHELTHSLVFSTELISMFPHDRSPLPSATEGLGFNYQSGYYGTGVSFLPAVDGALKAHVSTPRVARAAQRHFGCSSLRGAMLEDGGGSGTARTHWEMRLFRNE